MKTRALAVLAAIAALVAAVAAANAADLPVPVYKAPPPPPFSPWTGCYVAGGGGYGWWKQDSFLEVAGVPATASTSNGGNGWFGQGQAGCDYQFTAPFFNLPVLIGAFGDYEAGAINGTQDFPGAVGSERESATWSAGGRIGLLIAPRVLSYVDGGWTQAHFDQVSYNFAFPGGGATGLTLAAQTYNGWFVGGGFEYALDWLPFPGLFLKTEYRYSQYATANVPITGAGLAGVTLNSQKATEMISTELVWRFNWLAR